MNPNSMNRFATNPVNIDIQRSVFDRNHSVKFSGNVGDLIPFEVTEVLPGDTFSYDTTKVIRLQPLVAPIMDDLYADTYFFFCPTRLLWRHWQAFWGENEVGPWYPSVEYSVPQVQIPSGGYDIGTIADYMGVPVKQGAGEKISALPFRAYAKICDDWFRDENLMTPIYLPVDDNDILGSNGSDQVSDIVKGGKPFVACKYFDYFTACLPSPQKAPENAVTFNLAGFAPVYPREDRSFPVGTAANPEHRSLGWYIRDDSSATWSELPFDANVYDLRTGIFSSSDTNSRTVSDPSPSSGYLKSMSPNNLWADLASMSVFNVNELRTAFAIQRYYEKLARGGSRYIEFIKSFFNVTSPDARLQRSEYLGGSRLPLNVSQVEQTSATESGLTPQGNLTGISHTGEHHSDFTKSFTEHGYIIGVCVVRYHHTYQQGLERHWSRKDKFDYYNPTFANLGEQPVMSKEIFFNSSTANSGVFGYNEAWADYRYCPNRVAGEMRSNAPTPLDMWHLADNYASRPYLSADWIREDKSMLDRCLAVTSAVSNQIIFDFYIQSRAARPMPLYSIPGLIDHY